MTSLKFDQPVSLDRGIWIFLRTEERETVGSISYSFLSSRQGSFSRNLRPGLLEVKASAFDGKSGEKVVLTEWSDTSYRRRQDADKAFRGWIRENGIRAKVIEAAQKLLAARRDQEPEEAFRGAPR